MIKNKISLYASALLVSTNLMAAAPFKTIDSNSVLPYDYDSDNFGLQIVSGTTLNYTATSHMGAGVFIDTTNGYSNDNIGIWTDDITNNGTINVTDGGGYYGTRVFGIDTINSGVSLINNGTISVDSTYDSYGIYANMVNGTIVNSGTITATINGQSHYYGYALLLANGTGEFYNTGTINGVINSGLNVFENSGRINLPKGNTTWIKTFDQSANGILQIEVDSDSAGNVIKYSQLRGTDIAFATGSTIDVNVLNQNLLAGQTLSGVVEASGTGATLTANNLNITDNSALLDFTYALSNNGLSLDLQSITATVPNNGSGNDNNSGNSSSIIQNVVTLGGGNHNAQNAGGALSSIQNNGTYTGMNDVFSALNSLPTNESVANAVNSTVSQISNATINATSQISKNISNIVTTRQNINQSMGINTGDTDYISFADKNLWIKPFASKANQSKKDGIDGFDVNSYGLGLGIDGEYKENYQLGFGLFYTNADIDMDNMTQNADLDVVTGIIYGNAPIIDDKTKLLYQLGYSQQKTDSSRNISLTNQTATGDYTSKSATLDLKMVRDYKINDKLVLQPMVSTIYRHFNTPSYTESGAGALNLNVKSFNSDELLLGLGYSAFYKIDDESKFIGNVAVHYDLLDDENIVTSSYSGAQGVSFDTVGIDNGRWSYDLGLGYERNIAKNSNINLSYDFEGQGSDYTNHAISAKYVLNF